MFRQRGKASQCKVVGGNVVFYELPLYIHICLGKTAVWWQCCSYRGSLRDLVPTATVHCVAVSLSYYLLSHFKLLWISMSLKASNVNIIKIVLCHVDSLCALFLEGLVEDVCKSLNER